MEIMNNLILLETTSKESDNIVCDVCGKGILVPNNPSFDINHSFHCNKCGERIHLEANVVVE